LINILIVTHEDVGKALLKSAELIIGEKEKIAAVSLKRGDEIQQLIAEIESSLEAVDGEDDMLILTDLFGGSPCNAVISTADKYNFGCLTGVNLPMLLEALLSREKNDITLEQLVYQCKVSAIEGVKDVQIPFTN